MPVYLDVPYRTLWGWINESEENQKKYVEAKEEQNKIILMRIDEVFDVDKKTIPPKQSPKLTLF